MPFAMSPATSLRPSATYSTPSGVMTCSKQSVTASRSAKAASAHASTTLSSRLDGEFSRAARRRAPEGAGAATVNAASRAASSCVALDIFDTAGRARATARGRGRALGPQRAPAAAEGERARAVEVVEREHPEGGERERKAAPRA